MDEDDRLSQYRPRDGGPRSGRFRMDDNKDNVSDVTSRRRGLGPDDSFRADGGVPALESSVSRRSGKFIQAKTPGFKQNEEDSFLGRKVCSISTAGV